MVVLVVVEEEVPVVGVVGGAAEVVPVVVVLDWLTAVPRRDARAPIMSRTSKTPSMISHQGISVVVAAVVVVPVLPVLPVLGAVVAAAPPVLSAGAVGAGVASWNIMSTNGESGIACDCGADA